MLRETEMSKLLIKADKGHGHVAHVTPQSAGWTYVGFDLHRLRPGEVASGKTDDRQAGPVVALLVVEVITPGGHTSSYPPHKHDQDNLPVESYLEETYYHRLNPPQGFAFQRVYTDADSNGVRDLDEAMAIEDGDVVLVPK